MLNDRDAACIDVIRIFSTPDAGKGHFVQLQFAFGGDDEEEAKMLIRRGGRLQHRCVAVAEVMAWIRSTSNLKTS